MSDAVKTAQPSVTEAEWEAWRAYVRAHRALERALGDRLQADAGISNPDYSVLLALWLESEHRLRANEIARRIGWEKSRLSHQLSRLEDRGLIRREDCELDLRGKWIVITHAGRRAVLRAMRDHTRALREYFFDLLTDDERATLTAISQRVLERITPDEAADRSML